MTTRTTRSGALLRRITLLLLGATFATTACAQSDRQPDAHIGTAPDSSSVQGLPSHPQLRNAVEQVLTDSGVPGAAVIITSANNDEVLAVIGESNVGQATTASTLFAYRSITKSFVGTTVLMLVDEGRIDLAAPVSSYVDGIPGADNITVAQLGEMRSGLANYSAVEGFGDRLMQNLDGDVNIEELLEPAFAASPVFAPDERYQYSNTNTLVLGQIIEAATSEPWYEVVRRRIVEPLGLSSISYGLPNGMTRAATSAPAAAGFQLERAEVVEVFPYVSPDWFGAAGGLAGDVSDLAAWGRALGSGHLTTAETYEWQLDSLKSIVDDPASPYYDRYGFALGELDGWMGHTGAGLGFQSLVMYDPVSERVIAVLLNGTGENQDLPVKVFDAVSAL